MSRPEPDPDYTLAVRKDKPKKTKGLSIRKMTKSDESQSITMPYLSVDQTVVIQSPQNNGSGRAEITLKQPLISLLALDETADSIDLFVIEVESRNNKAVARQISDPELNSILFKNKPLLDELKTHNIYDITTGFPDQSDTSTDTQSAEEMRSNRILKTRMRPGTVDKINQGISFILTNRKGREVGDWGLVSITLSIAYNKDTKIASPFKNLALFADNERTIVRARDASTDIEVAKHATLAAVSPMSLCDYIIAAHEYVTTHEIAFDQLSPHNSPTSGAQSQAFATSRVTQQSSPLLFQQPTPSSASQNHTFSQAQTISFCTDEIPADGQARIGAILRCIEDYFDYQSSSNLAAFDAFLLRCLPIIANTFRHVMHPEQLCKLEATHLLASWCCLNWYLEHESFGDDIWDLDEQAMIRKIMDEIKLLLAEHRIQKPNEVIIEQHRYYKYC